MGFESMKISSKIELFLERNSLIKSRLLKGQLTGNRSGWFSMIGTPERNYLEIFHYDDNKISLELHPCVTCERPYLGQLREYFGMINDYNTLINFRVKENGYIYVLVTSLFDKEEISDYSLIQMEGTAIAYMDIFIEDIQRISSGRLMLGIQNPLDKILESIEEMKIQSELDEEYGLENDFDNLE